MEGLLYLLFSGFQANKSHAASRFQLVRINPSGGAVENFQLSTELILRGFQLVRINPSGGVSPDKKTLMVYHKFPISPH
jgi:hypothetical protein